jgi:hypothetical protein
MRQARVSRGSRGATAAPGKVEPCSPPASFLAGAMRQLWPGARLVIVMGWQVRACRARSLYGNSIGR